ncbi:MAG: aldolase [Alphaproteobacteria bacterium]|nr:aldolase [Alphaproteobacteria bacterium]
MALAVNRAKERLQKGELAIGIGTRLVRNVDIVKVMKAAGYDWLFIDCEHGSMSVETACEISVAAQDSGIAPIVRVPAGELTLATRCLDGGALGIVVPHVDTEAQAREIADRLRYPPRGHRSVGGGQAQLDYAPMPLGELTAAIDGNTLVVVMIETPEAVANADAIAAVPGIDILLIGANDLSMELGIPGDTKHPKIQAAADAVVAACRKHGKWPGMGGAYTEELLKIYTAKGMKFMLAGNDLPMLVAAARDHQKKVRSFQ